MSQQQCPDRNYHEECDELVDYALAMIQEMESDAVGTCTFGKSLQDKIWRLQDEMRDLSIENDRLKLQGAALVFHSMT